MRTTGNHGLKPSPRPSRQPQATAKLAASSGQRAAKAASWQLGYGPVPALMLAVVAVKLL